MSTLEPMMTVLLAAVVLLATRPHLSHIDDAESELSDDQLDKIAGGLIQQRFNSLRIRPVTD